MNKKDCSNLTEIFIKCNQIYKDPKNDNSKNVYPCDSILKIIKDQKCKKISKFY
jgi:hypothetical protein